MALWRQSQVEGIKTKYVPGGRFERRIQPYYRVQPPFVLHTSGAYKSSQIMGSESFWTLVVVPLEPTVRFWSDADRLARGECTWLHWDVEGVREVYLAGEGVVGNDRRQVCAEVTTSYELEVVHLDGAVTRRAVEIEVVAP